MDNQNKIKKLLRENTQGLTIQNLADESKLSRQTISVILAELRGGNKVDIRQIGQAKLHFLKKQ